MTTSACLRTFASDLEDGGGLSMAEPETEYIRRRTALAFRLFVIAGLALSAGILLLILLPWP